MYSMLFALVFFCSFLVALITSIFSLQMQATSSFLVENVSDCCTSRAIFLTRASLLSYAIAIKINAVIPFLKDNLIWRSHRLC